MGVARLKRHYPGYDAYIPTDAYFICDRCGQRHRRSGMFTEWTGLKVDAKCLDPRPPQQQPPNVYPEGMPFFDARPPGDNPDRLQDDTTLESVVGGFGVSPPGQYHNGGQNQVPGAISPQELVENPTPLGPNVLQDDITFITGVVAAPSVTITNSPPACTSLPYITSDGSDPPLLTGFPGTWTGVDP